MGGSAPLTGKMAVGKLIIIGKAHEAKLETHNWIDKRGVYFMNSRKLIV